MTRPTHVWGVFLCCLAVVTGVMLWISHRALQLEAQEAEAASQHESERLALWRMETTLVPLITAESARPYLAYQPFYPSSNVFSPTRDELKPVEVLVPSSLLANESPFVILHFQCDQDGLFSSPEVPGSELKSLVGVELRTPDKLTRYASQLQKLQDRLEHSQLLALAGGMQLRGPLDATSTVVDAEVEPPPVIEQVQQLAATQNGAVQVNQQQLAEGGPSQQVRSLNEYRIRSGTNIINNTIANIAANSGNGFEYGMQTDSLALAGYDAIPAVVGAMRPVWISDQLLLLRPVRVQQSDVVQGCVIDWPRLETVLTEQISDLLPNSKLAMADAAEAINDPLMLASLPVRLIPGKVSPVPNTGWTPMQWTLAIAWAWLIATAIAVLILLLGVVRLSERRAAFVSAVTHELRTPLTTFRLYTDLIGNHTATDSEKTSRYVETLRREAERLSHLVENVLAYSRLERNREPRMRSAWRVSELFDSLSVTLNERVAQSGMRYEVHYDSVDPQQLSIRTEPSAIERILINLVDNACKYASDSDDALIRVIVTADSARVSLCVQDSGPGISAAQRKRLFAPFTKSATEAARSAPGVGLGLSLARRLAREMGGDLVCESAERGASFRLTIPRC